MTSTRIKLGSMTKSSAYFAEARRYRLSVDAAYLNALAVRLADVLGLPLKVARQRVERMAISAGAARDPGSDARWWKVPRSRERFDRDRFQC